MNALLPLPSAPGEPRPGGIETRCSCPQGKNREGQKRRERFLRSLSWSGRAAFLTALCRNSTRKSLEFSRRSADLFCRSAARPRWTRKSRGPKKQVYATLPRPKFLTIMGSRKAGNAQNGRKELGGADPNGRPITGPGNAQGVGRLHLRAWDSGLREQEVVKSSPPPDYVHEKAAC
jgi:hypothetical protein